MLSNDVIKFFHGYLVLCEDVVSETNEQTENVIGAEVGPEDDAVLKTEGITAATGAATTPPATEAATAIATKTDEQSAKENDKKRKLDKVVDEPQTRSKRIQNRNKHIYIQLKKRSTD